MTYTKINRREARKLFNKGEIISMGASKMRPEWSAMVCNALNRTFEQVEMRCAIIIVTQKQVGALRITP